MTVFDASVLVDALVVAGPAGDDAREVLRDLSVLHVSSIFAAEATSAIRSMRARGDVSTGQALGAVSKIKLMRTVQYPFEPFLDRVWELRDNLTVYDGWYVALAESLDTSLVTADRRLAQASGPRCPVVEVVRFATGSPRPPAQRNRPPVITPE
ncbi:MAG: type II toxin-antitoxin system VapC family toxin [Pseudonocardiaceae bacterium]